MARIVVVAKEYNEASMAKLKDDLTANGVKKLESIDEIGAVLGDYEGDLEVLAKIDNVEEARPEGRFYMQGNQPKL